MTRKGMLGTLGVLFSLPTMICAFFAKLGSATGLTVPDIPHANHPFRAACANGGHEIQYGGKTAGGGGVPKYGSPGWRGDGYFGPERGAMLVQKAWWSDPVGVATRIADSARGLWHSSLGHLNLLNVGAIVRRGRLSLATAAA